MMQIATCSSKVWICTLYYAIDNKFNIYFISEPATRHCKDISLNKNIACAITETNQKVIDKKHGVQLSGLASIVKGGAELKSAIKAWNKSNPGMEKWINFKTISTNKIRGKFYKIKPNFIKFFNEELYGSEGFKNFKI